MQHSLYIGDACGLSRDRQATLDGRKPGVILCSRPRALIVRPDICDQGASEPFAGTKPRTSSNMPLRMIEPPCPQLWFAKGHHLMTNPLPDLRSVLFDLEANPLHEIADALLSSGWNFTDPDGFLRITPANVQDFLQRFTWRKQDIGELSPGARNLLNGIVDAYARAYRAQKATSDGDEIPF